MAAPKLAVENSFEKILAEYERHLKILEDRVLAQEKQIANLLKAKETVEDLLEAKETSCQCA